MKVYTAIAEVMTAFSKEGISKDRTNTQGSTYKFRGIDDVLNALSGHLSRAGLVVIPRVLSRECVERVTKSGGAIFYTNVDVEFDLVAAEDGSKHTARVQGEAMDTSDKSTNKAMSAAYKYMAFQTFCIPTEGDNDADASTHELKAKSSAALKREDAWSKTLSDLEADMLDVKTEMALDRLQKDYEAKAAKEGWTEAWKNSLTDVFIGYRSQLHEDNLWQEMTALTTLSGLQSFWTDHVGDIKRIGPTALKKFTAEKDRLKSIFDAKTSTLNAL